jgi:hypothetical protein
MGSLRAKNASEKFSRLGTFKEFLMKVAYPDTHVDLYFLSMMVELSAKKEKNYHSAKTTFFVFYPFCGKKQTK